MRHMTAALLLATLAACSSSTTTPLGATARTSESVAQRDVGRAFEMKTGETVSVGALRLTLRNVESDSRCPIDAVCVWAGDAEIALRIEQGSLAAVAALHTTLEPKKTEWNGYTIAFVSLAPSPRASQAIDPADYRATILVTR